MTRATRRQVMDALREHFRPEFLNRIDEIIFFHALGREHMKQIIDIQIAGLIKRLEERKIHVELTDAAKDLLVARRLRSDLRRPAAQADDPAPGARPAGDARARGRVPRRRHRRGRRRRRRADVRQSGDGGAGIDRPSVMPTLDTTTNPIRRGSIRAAAIGADRAPGRRPPGVVALVRPRLPAAARPRAGVYYLTPAGRIDPLQRVQAAGRRTARSPRSRSATSRSAARSKPAATPSRPRPFTDDARRRSEADRGARGARRQVHRRGREPLAAGSARLDHPAALLRRHLGLLLPPHGRRRRRRDVVRAQPGEDLRRRRSEGALRRRRRRRRSRGRAEGDRRVPEDTRRNTPTSAAGFPRACCWSARRAPARRCSRARSPAKRTCPSSA